jgi:hypothetical protein
MTTTDLAGLARAVAIAAALWQAIGGALVLAPLAAELVTLR